MVNIDLTEHGTASKLSGEAAQGHTSMRPEWPQPGFSEGHPLQADTVPGQGLGEEPECLQPPRLAL